jgi:hypothetical protein
MFSLGARDAKSWQQGGESTISESLINVMGILNRNMGHQGFSVSNIYSHRKAEPQEQRGLTLYTLASRLQKQKARFNPYIVACNSIGSPPVLCDLLYV